MAATVSPAVPSARAGSADAGHLRAVARGGTLNLVGAVAYGVLGFAVVAVLTRRLPTASAGAVLVAIALFTVVSRTAELGSGTGLVRGISRAVALGRSAEVPRLLVVATVPVAAVSCALAALTWRAAGPLGELLAGGGDAARVGAAVRALAVALPGATLASVLVSATRGFGTMVPQLVVDKLGRPLLQPVTVAAATASTAASDAVAAAWAVPMVLALVPVLGAVDRLVAGLPPAAVGPRPYREIAGEFWRFSAPRAASQVFQVTILWFDTLLLGVLTDAGEAGIYAAATRFVLVGTFAAEALQQVVAPRTAALLAADDTVGAGRVLEVAAAWQVLLVWPPFCVLAVFAPTVLSVFGGAYTAGAGVLVVLAVGLLAGALAGPADSVLLMAGASCANLAVTAASATVNVGANLVLVPRVGMIGAAFAWSASLVIGAVAPALLVRRCGIRPGARPAAVAAATVAGTMGAAAVASAVLVGRSPLAVAVALAVGGAALVAVAVRRPELEVATFVGALTRRRPPRGAP